MEIWIAVIGFFKDIIVAIIGLIKKSKSNKPQKISTKSEDLDEYKNNPFIPSNIDIEKIDIKDSNYLPTIAIYLAANRSTEDIKVIDKEEKNGIYGQKPK